MPRKRKSDKADFGHVLVLAGSRGMSGAAVLAVRAALSSGSGLVTHGVPSGLRRSMRGSPPEALTLELPETSAGSLSEAALDPILEYIAKRRVNSLLIGPGLSVHRSTASLVRRLVHVSAAPMVLDADGLNVFKGNAAAIAKRASPIVMTPHRREFERLFSEKWPKRQSDRLRLAKRIARIYDAVLVLKGYRTLVVSPSRQVVNKTGNPGMAKGGSGDVLAGILAAFIAQGLGVFEAARWAVYFHGLAGDLAAREKSELSVLASDLIDFLPQAFRRGGSLK